MAGLLPKQKEKRVQMGFDTIVAVAVRNELIARRPMVKTLLNEPIEIGYRNLLDLSNEELTYCLSCEKRAMGLAKLREVRNSRSHRPTEGRAHE